jgi:hypothetical protein
MTEQLRIRWEVELFGACEIPPQGYIFFCREKTYLCYPSESVDLFSVCLSAVIKVLHKYAEHAPPDVLYVPYCNTARTSSGIKG